MLMFVSMLAQAQPVVLSEEVPTIRERVDTLDATRCEAVLQGVFDELAPLRPDQVDLADASEHGEALVDALFASRVALQSQLTAFHHAGTLTPGCISGARRFDLAVRYLTDHFYLAGTDHDAWVGTPGFGGPEDLRAGDILVTRGAGLSSAGIAHIGQLDSQFSHNAMVHVDAEGRVWTVEAYLERGALVQPLDRFLEHGLGRIAVIRFEDPELAARGAALAYDRVATGPAIDYDEAFDSSSADELFCSEIGPWAIGLAGGPTDLPLHRTRFPRSTNPAMFDAMGIDADDLAAPVDLLLDPRFTLVAEWRAVEHLEDMRRQDAVVESVFTWMERDGYTLEARWADRATVDVGLAVRRTPVLGRALASRVHPHGDRGFLVAGLAMQQAGEAVYTELNARLDPVGYTSREEMLTLLERIRAEDLATWHATPRKARFHRNLHPADDGVAAQD
ncbi:MAG: YiiX/YebB-like N1pC/P60 family cysteine hydrolase [Myxococcota bacterium]